MRKRVVREVAVVDKVDAEVTAVIAGVGRTRARMSLRMMTIARLVSSVPVRARRSDKVVAVMDVVVAIVVTVVTVVTVAEIVSVVTVDAKSAATDAIVASRASVGSARSVQPSLVSVNSVSRSLWTKRLASTLEPERLTESPVTLLRRMLSASVVLTPVMFTE
jgi:hypothetical protein